MQDHYQTLGVNSSATQEEIRRAYRILARRYHPDVNPGERSGEKFKAIAEAYRVLNGAASRKQYDIEYEQNLRHQAHRRFEAYRQAQSHAKGKRAASSTGAGYSSRAHENLERARAKQQKPPAKKSSPKKNTPDDTFDSFLSLVGKGYSAVKNVLPSLSKDKKKKPGGATAQPHQVSIIEVSLSFRDAVFGVKKTVEIAEPEGTRKVSVNIPPGVRTGSVIRLRAKKKSAFEELVLIARVAAHPVLALQTKGLVMEVPVTIREAILGASITVPTFADPAPVRIPPGSQSGTEIRLREKGVQGKDGKRGDLFARLMVRVPESIHAVGIEEKAQEIDLYYEANVRKDLPGSLEGYL